MFMDKGSAAVKGLFVSLFLTLLSITAFGQSTNCRPDPFTGGYNCSGPSGTTTIRPDPFTGGYNVNGPYGTSTIRPDPFTGGYNVNGPYGTSTTRPDPFTGGYNIPPAPNYFNYGDRRF